MIKLKFTKEKTLSGKKTSSGEKNKFYKSLSLASELGLAISLPIVGGAFLGRFLDDKLGSAPRLTLSLIFLGLFFSAINLYNLIKNLK